MISGLWTLGEVGFLNVVLGLGLGFADDVVFRIFFFEKLRN